MHRQQWALSCAVVLALVAAGTSEGAKKKIAALADCPAWGAEPQGSSRGLLNEVKHRVPEARQPRPIGFDDIDALQKRADALVRSGRDATVTADDRAKLRDLTGPTGRFGEGDLVALRGFLVGRAKANVGESANCRLPGASNNDFEFWVARSPTATPYEAIVAEMIPQNRPARWTLGRLRQLAESGSEVQVVGQLMFDTEHVPNPAPGAAPGLPRRSVWEVHPVTTLLVCTKGTGCDPSGPADWQPM